MSTRLFGEPISRKRDFVANVEERKFEIKTDVSKLFESHATYPEGTTKETISFAHSAEAKLLVNANDAEGFIQQIFKLEHMNMNGVMSSENIEERSDWFYQVNYVAVVIAALGAVVLVVIDITRTGVEDEKFVLNYSNKPFVTALICSAKEAGGVKFAQNVAKVFAEKMIEAHHQLQAEEAEAL